MEENEKYIVTQPIIDENEVKSYFYSFKKYGAGIVKFNGDKNVLLTDDIEYSGGIRISAEDLPGIIKLLQVVNSEINK